MFPEIWKHRCYMFPGQTWKHMNCCVSNMFPFVETTWKHMFPCIIFCYKPTLIQLSIIYIYLLNILCQQIPPNPFHYMICLIYFRTCPSSIKCRGHTNFRVLKSTDSCKNFYGRYPDLIFKSLSCVSWRQAE